MKSLSVSALFLLISALPGEAAIPTPGVYPAFFGRIETLDRESASDWGRYSRCAAFSRLFAELYELNNRDSERTLGDAALFLGDTSLIFSKLGNGAKKLSVSPKVISPWDPLARKIVRIIQGPMITAQIIQKRMEVQGFSEWSNSKSSHRGLVSINDLRARAVLKLGAPRENFILPLWLSDHRGGGKGDTPSIGDQDKAHGYIQLSGDPDGTGRHDHLIANILVGYSAATQGIGRFLFLPTVKAAPYIDEYHGLHQNKSATDLRVNQAGIKIGIRIGTLERKGQTLDPWDLNRAVFSAVCDESAVTPHIRGPLF